MIRLLFCFALCPFTVLAQSDTLKPIGSDLLPSTYWAGNTWQPSTRIQYTYDGIDVKARNLGQYIQASGNADAIREYNVYLTGRHVGGWLIAGGIITSAIGLGIGLANDRPAESLQRPYSPNGTPVNGTICYGNCNPTPAQVNSKGIRTGVAMLLSGVVVSAIGGWMLRPGQHVRRAVQYYNRSLDRRSVSWQLTPYSNWRNSGLSVVGRF